MIWGAKLNTSRKNTRASPSIRAHYDDNVQHFCMHFAPSKAMLNTSRKKCERFPLSKAVYDDNVQHLSHSCPL